MGLFPKSKRATKGFVGFNFPLLPMDMQAHLVYQFVLERGMGEFDEDGVLLDGRSALDRMLIVRLFCKHYAAAWKEQVCTFAFKLFIRKRKEMRNLVPRPTFPQVIVAQVPLLSRLCDMTAEMMDNADAVLLTQYVAMAKGHPEAALAGLKALAQFYTCKSTETSEEEH